MSLSCDPSVKALLSQLKEKWEMLCCKTAQQDADE